MQYRNEAKLTWIRTLLNKQEMIRVSLAQAPGNMRSNCSFRHDQTTSAGIKNNLKEKTQTIYEVENSKQSFNRGHQKEDSNSSDQKIHSTIQLLRFK